MMNRTEYFKQNLNGRVLDLGCDQGELHRLIDDGTIIGLDMESKNYQERVIRGNVVEMPIKNDCFDTIIAGEIIEHMPKPEKMLEECNRVLKNRGTILISTPNKNAWNNRLFHHFDHRLAKSRGRRWMHQSVMSGAELKELCGKYFEIRETFYLPYDEVSSPNRYEKKKVVIGKAYFLVRRMIHPMLPRKMREQMIIKCTSKKRFGKKGAGK